MPVASIGGAVIGGVVSNRASKKAAKSADKAAAAQIEATNRQLAIAEEQWNRYKSTYGPLEDEVIQESRDFGSEANRAKAAQEAQGAVTSSFAGLREQLRTTPGLDPSSAKYLTTTAKLGLQEAAQGAAAQTGARRNVDAVGAAMKRDALSLGKGLPGNSTAALQGAAMTASAAGNNAARGVANAQMQGAAVGRMVGDVLSAPETGKFLGGLFPSSTPDVSGGVHAVVPSAPMGEMAGVSGW